MNLSDWIERHSAFTPEKTAIRFFETSSDGDPLIWNYAQFAKRIRQLARGLKHELGVGRGDRVGFLGMNHPDMLVMLFACARLGAMLVPLNWRLVPPEHEYILQNAGMHSLVVEQRFREHTESILCRFPAVNFVSLDFSGESWKSFASILMESGGDDLNTHVGYENPLLILYTSGTTGKPKGAVLTQNALFWNALNSMHLHEFTSRDHVLSVLPLFHAGPLNIQTTPALYTGKEVTLASRFDPGETLKLIEEMRPTLLLLVPATMQAMLRHPAWGKTDLSSLRMLVTGSSVVPLDLIKAYHQRNIPVGQVYGSTETCPISVYLRTEDAVRKEGSTGKSALHTEVRIVNENGTDQPENVPGELLVRGPNVMREYWGNVQATAAALHEGWYRTGDIGFQDNEGFIYINDRKNDIIISGGENIYPAELEVILLEKEGVTDAAAVARHDPEWGEVPVVFLVCQSFEKPGKVEVLSWFNNRIARYKAPRDVYFLDEMPRNSMGKVLKYELRKIASKYMGS